MQESGQLCDIMLCVSGDLQVPLHSCVAAAYSTVLAEIMKVKDNTTCIYIIYHFLIFLILPSTCNHGETGQYHLKFQDRVNSGHVWSPSNPLTISLENEDLVEEGTVLG